MNDEESAAEDMVVDINRELKGDINRELEVVSSTDVVGDTMEEKEAVNDEEGGKGVVVGVLEGVKVVSSTDVVGDTMEEKEAVNDEEGGKGVVVGVLEGVKVVSSTDVVGDTIEEKEAVNDEEGGEGVVAILSTVDMILALVVTSTVKEKILEKSSINDVLISSMDSVLLDIIELVLG